MIDSFIDIALILLALPTICGLFFLGIAYIIAYTPDSDQDQPVVAGERRSAVVSRAVVGPGYEIGVTGVTR